MSKGSTADDDIDLFFTDRDHTSLAPDRHSGQDWKTSELLPGLNDGNSTLPGLNDGNSTLPSLNDGNSTLPGLNSTYSPLSTHEAMYSEPFALSSSSSIVRSTSDNLFDYSSTTLTDPFARTSCGDFSGNEPNTLGSNPFSWSSSSLTRSNTSDQNIFDLEDFGAEKTDLFDPSLKSSVTNTRELDVSGQALVGQGSTSKHGAENAICYDGYRGHSNISQFNQFERAMHCMTTSFLTCLSASCQKTQEGFSDIKQSLNAVLSKVTDLQTAMNTTGTSLLTKTANNFAHVDANEQLAIHVMIKHLTSIGNGLEIGWPEVSGNDNVSVIVSIRLLKYVLNNTYHRKISVAQLEQIVAKYDTSHTGTRQMFKNKASTWFDYFGLVPLSSTYIAGKQQFKKINLKSLLMGITKPCHSDFSPVVIESGIKKKPFVRPSARVNRPTNYQGSERKMHARGTDVSKAYTLMSKILCRWYLDDTTICPQTRLKLQTAYQELAKNEGFLDINLQFIGFKNR
jgi:hypothetical protein